jgi:hypothetical protein
VRREPPTNDAFKIWIDIEQFRTMLDDGRAMPGRVRLMFEIAVRSGRVMMTLGELKKLVLDAIATSGITRAAIRAVTSGSRRPQSGLDHPGSDGAGTLEQSRRRPRDRLLSYTAHRTAPRLSARQRNAS